MIVLTRNANVVKSRCKGGGGKHCFSFCSVLLLSYAPYDQALFKTYVSSNLYRRKCITISRLRWGGGEVAVYTSDRMIPNIIFNILLYFTSITTYIYTELSPKLTAAASVAQSIECWSRDWGSRVQFPAGDLGVSFFATGPSWVLKCMFFWQSNLPYFKNNLSVNNEYKCQILSMRKTTVD